MIDIVYSGVVRTAAIRCIFSLYADTLLACALTDCHHFCIRCDIFRQDPYYARHRRATRYHSKGRESTCLQRNAMVVLLTDSITGNILS